MLQWDELNAGPIGLKKLYKTRSWDLFLSVFTMEWIYRYIIECQYRLTKNLYCWTYINHRGLLQKENDTHSNKNVQNEYL